MITCGCCGSGIDSPHIDGIWIQGEQVTCPHCEAINRVLVDEDDGEAYSAEWRCVHGASDVEPCDQCDPPVERGEPPPSVSIDPGVSFGRPVMRGTAIQVAVMESMNSAGDSIDSLAKSYYIDETGALVCGICPIKQRKDSIRMYDVPALLAWARAYLDSQHPVYLSKYASPDQLREIIGRKP